jgi:hypothetical protein
MIILVIKAYDLSSALDKTMQNWGSINDFDDFKAI